MLRVLSSATEMTLMLFLRKRKENREDIVHDPRLWNGIPQRIKLVEKEWMHYLCSHQHFSGMMTWTLFYKLHIFRYVNI